MQVSNTTLGDSRTVVVASESTTLVVASQNQGPAGAATSESVLELETVIESVFRSYPLLEAAYQERAIASGVQTTAQGAFDLNLKGETIAGPLGFYETYRNSIGVEQALFSGGSVFGGYRVGRGDFQPWYQERQTNDGGELLAGVRVPLARNRQIDSRRAALWHAMYGRDRAEPFIESQLIEFLRAATFAYWDWISAGRNYQISKSLLEIAQQRQHGLKRHVEEGNLPQIDLTDNERLIVSREAKLIEARGKLNQAAVKLSLFFSARNWEFH